MATKWTEKLEKLTLIIKQGFKFLDALCFGLE